MQPCMYMRRSWMHALRCCLVYRIVQGPCVPPPGEAPACCPPARTYSMQQRRPNPNSWTTPNTPNTIVKTPQDRAARSAALAAGWAPPRCLPRAVHLRPAEALASAPGSTPVLIYTLEAACSAVAPQPLPPTSTGRCAPDHGPCHGTSPAQHSSLATTPCGGPPATPPTHT